jgi:hypothetical protein
MFLFYQKGNKYSDLLHEDGVFKTTKLMDLEQWRTEGGV